MKLDMIIHKHVPRRRLATSSTAGMSCMAALIFSRTGTIIWGQFCEQCRRLSSQSEKHHKYKWWYEKLTKEKPKSGTKWVHAPPFMFNIIIMYISGKLVLSCKNSKMYHSAITKSMLGLHDQTYIIDYTYGSQSRKVVITSSELKLGSCNSSSPFCD